MKFVRSFKINPRKFSYKTPAEFPSPSYGDLSASIRVNPVQEFNSSKLPSNSIKAELLEMFLPETLLSPLSPSPVKNFVFIFPHHPNKFSCLCLLCSHQDSNLGPSPYIWQRVKNRSEYVPS